jgi:hypothetical protein
MKEQLEYDESDNLSFISIMSYIKDNIIQIIMFFSVFVIIYLVDHISNINTILFSMPPPIPLPLQKHKNVKKNNKK